MRPLVLALLDLTRQLRQGQDGHAQFLGQGLEGAGDFRHLLHPVLLVVALADGDQLQIVDDDQVEAVLLAFQAAGAGGELGDRQAAGGVDEQGAFADLDGRLADAAEIGGVDLALAQLVRGHARGIRQDAHGQLFGAHFQRIEGDHPAADRLAALGRRLPAVVARDVEGDVGRQRGLAHRRAAGEDQQVGGVQAAQLGVQIVQMGGQTGQFAVALIGLGGHLHRATEGA